jgi:plasmid stabilization system protein ParE
VLQVVFSPAARADMVEAAAWYGIRSPVLAERFIAEANAAVARISENVMQFPVVLRDVRRARLGRFPYGLFFRLDGDTVHVIACFHASRNPRRWRQRV